MSGFLLFLVMKTIPTRRLALGESSWIQGEHRTTSSPTYIWNMSNICPRAGS